MSGQSEYQKFMGPEHDAIIHRVQRFNRRITDFDDPTAGGSGTAIRIYDRFFIATAAHVIEADHRYALGKHEGEREVRSFPAKGFNLALEVGFLEVAAEALDDHDSFAEVKDLAPMSDHIVEVVVAGFPGVGLRRLSAGMCAKADLVRCDTVPVSDWPGDCERPTRPENDIFVNYPKTLGHQELGAGRGFDESSARQRETDDPRGMSGGGIWHYVLNENRESGIRYPGPRLLGIQVSVYERQRSLRGTQIRHWCDLVGKHYPEMKLEL